MCTQTANIHKANQPHIAGALRQFADSEVIKSVAEQAGVKSQVLRNKLLHDQPHQLTVQELVKITRASGNRCIVDGVLLELNCTTSVSLEELANYEQMPLTDRAIDINLNAAQLAALALDVKLQRKVTERIRHEAVSRAQRVMGELAIFVHDVEQKFQAIPVLSITADAVQTMPMPGLM